MTLGVLLCHSLPSSLETLSPLDLDLRLSPVWMSCSLHPSQYWGSECSLAMPT
ncbi:hypothetical protein I79_017929 [Cricetulus griseus]|uniref:Uncharacterized protein n=1 Tax=Cricetulus griseus TaxID=10029 RepID=G3I3C5_CRIGR|nr:hypothetical protein I79_017929 [Cricetulus griseus]